MANTVITSTTNSIKVVFNDDSTLAGNLSKGTWVKSEISHVGLKSDHIVVVTKDESRWTVSNATNTSNYLKVDSVDAASPSSLSDLYDKLVALIA